MAFLRLDTALIAFIGVAFLHNFVQVRGDLTPFQEEKFEQHFRLAEAGGNGILTIDDYDLIAHRIMQLAGYTKYNEDTMHNDVVVPAWNAFPGQNLTHDQYMDFARNEANHEAIIEAAENLAAIMFDVWNNADPAGEEPAIDLEELRGEWQSLMIPTSYAEPAFAALDADNSGGISKEEYVSAAEDYFSTDDESHPSKYFLCVTCHS